MFYFNNIIVIKNLKKIRNSGLDSDVSKNNQL